MEYRAKIPPKWDKINYIQVKLEKKLAKHEKSYKDSVKMVAGELLENSVKYYKSKGINKPIEFFFTNSNETEISILNQFVEPEDLKNITELIDSINNSDNPYFLYLERLQEILENRVKGESRLGLLRVVSDGRFILNYKTDTDLFSITASKKAIRGVKKMKKLKYEDLIIEICDHGSQVEVKWLGKSRTLNPEMKLDQYLEELSIFLNNRKALISFNELESMNSSTIPPILTFIKKLEENSVDAILLYNDEEDWQNASFKPLSVIISNYNYVAIKSLAEYNNM